MVKTLKDEIVEGLRKAATDYMVIALGCCSGILPRRFYDESVESSVEMGQLATKVESARCENCISYDKEFSHCEFNGNFLNAYDGCWQFDPKEK